MRESFGTRLRQQRERQQVALTTIAERTKIKASLLEALERDDISHWPVGIFRRAFMRAYAGAIGLEPDVAVREFLELYPDPLDGIANLPVVPSATEGSPNTEGPPTRLRYLVGSAIGSLTTRFRSAESERTGAPAPDSTSTVPVQAESDSPPAAEAPLPQEPDLAAAARLCTNIGRLERGEPVTPLLDQAVGILDAVGLIVWIWDPQAAELKVALAHGYPSQLLVRLPAVKRDADNATAAAFRSAEMSVVTGSRLASGALAAPLMAPGACVGVLAVELRHGSEQTTAVRAVVTMIAAQLARWIEAGRVVEVLDRLLA